MYAANAPLTTVSSNILEYYCNNECMKRSTVELAKYVFPIGLPKFVSYINGRYFQLFYVTPLTRMDQIKYQHDSIIICLVYCGRNYLSTSKLKFRSMVWELISNFIPHSTGRVIHAGIKAHLC